jgi:RHS repeat-associated protein
MRNIHFVRSVIFLILLFCLKTGYSEVSVEGDEPSGHNLVVTRGFIPPQLAAAFGLPNYFSETGLPYDKYKLEENVYYIPRNCLDRIVTVMTTEIRTAINFFYIDPNILPPPPPVITPSKKNYNNITVKEIYSLKNSYAESSSGFYLFQRTDQVPVIAPLVETIPAYFGSNGLPKEEYKVDHNIYIIPREYFNDIKEIRSWCGPAKYFFELKDENEMMKAEYNTSVIYYDEFGRGIQELRVDQTPGGRTSVLSKEYDYQNNIKKQYIPFVVEDHVGEYYSDYGNNANWNGLLNEDRDYAFSETEYSVRNNVSEQGFAGEAWQIYDKSGVKKATRNTLRNEFKVCSETGIPKLEINPDKDIVCNGCYEKEELLTSITLDENNNESRIYKDNFGNIIIKKSKVGDKYLITSYVYDGRNRLVYVIPPEAYSKLIVNGTLVNNPGYQEILDNYCYQYIYDSRFQDKVLVKKLPGKDCEYTFYNRYGLPVIIQDGELRKKNKCMYVKYDMYQRVVQKGIYSQGNLSSLMPESYAATVYSNTSNDWYEEKTSNGSYTNKVFPNENIEILEETYYDDYSFKNRILFNHEKSVSTGAYNTRVKGLVTGSKVKLLNSTVNEWIYETNYYDEKYRLIQTLRKYAETKKYSLSSKYDYVGNVLKSKEWCNYDGNDNIVETEYEYDRVSRLLSIHQSINNLPMQELVKMEYDELGQLINKKLHGNLQNVAYAYNIRGWLKSISSSKYKMKLFYEDANELSSLSPVGQFNGNISGMIWQNESEDKQAYAFEYDGISRILSANYGEGTTLNRTYRYDVSGIEYDKNGNILSLERKMNGSEIDKLSYGYDGNKLKFVNDLMDKKVGFKESSTSTASEYLYDSNGNMVKDLNKGITNIDYNFLNLPQEINKSDGKNIKYIYSATGEKIHNILPSKTLTYIGSFVYEDNRLSYVLNCEGKYMVNGSNGSYEYNLTDHLGNVRVVFDETGQTKQTNNYYPFGMTFVQSGANNNKYLYNGKELQEETDWLDYGARMYDPAIGRWHVADAHTENYLSWSPYNYAANNPMLFVDPDGQDIVFYIWEKDEDDDWQRKQVKFSQLDEKLQKAIEAFAKTDEGFDFFKDFANEGDKIGSVEFTSTGKYSKHDMEVAQFDSYGSAYGTSSFSVGKKNITFDMKINIGRNAEDENKESIAITIGHEVFIHMQQYKDKLINAHDKQDYSTINKLKQIHRRNSADRSGGPDHDGYISGDKKYSKMRIFVTQLRNIFNPKQVDKQIKAHDKNYKKK